MMRGGIERLVTFRVGFQRCYAVRWRNLGCFDHCKDADRASKIASQFDTRGSNTANRRFSSGSKATNAVILESIRRRAPYRGYIQRNIT